MDVKNLGTQSAVDLRCGDCASRFPDRTPGFLGRVNWFQEDAESWGSAAVTPHRCWIDKAHRVGRRDAERRHGWLEAQAQAGGLRMPQSHTFPYGRRTEASVIVVDHGRGTMVDSLPWWLELRCPSCPAKPSGPIGLLVQAALRQRDKGETVLLVGSPADRERSAA